MASRNKSAVKRKRKNTLEPKNVTTAKLNLKRTKRFTAEIEQIARALHSSQCDILSLSRTLSEKLKNIHISDISDKFGIFANNMGLAISSNHMEEMQEMHLMNMEDDFIKPLNQFNKISVANAQKLKNKLNKIANKNNRTSFKKTTNIKRKKSTKITHKNVTKSSKKITNKKKKSTKKVTNNSTKKLTNKNAKKSFKKTTNKNKKTDRNKNNKSDINSEQLVTVQNVFIASIAQMESDKICLVSSFKSYFQSYSIFTNLNCQNLKLYGHTMHNMPSRTSTFSVQSNESYDIDEDKQKGTIEKEGWMKKKGGMNSNKPFKRRWCKLFRNKKLKYFDKPNGASKGHADFTNIIKMEKDNTHSNDGKFVFCVATQRRLWIFELETKKNRNDWYDTIERVCYKNSDENVLEIELDGPQITMMSVDDSNNYLSHAQRNYIRSKPGFQAKNMLNTPVSEGQFGMTMNVIAMNELVVINDGVENTGRSPVFSPLPAYYISHN